MKPTHPKTAEGHQTLGVDVSPACFALLMPAYNEAERIGETLDHYLKCFTDQCPIPWRIVVVLNGCRDATLSVVQAFTKKDSRIVALEYRAPIGKGGALIEGIRHTQKAGFIGYTDADGATPAEAMLALLETCRNDSLTHGVIGSRWLPGARLHQAQTFTRRLASRVFHAIVQGLFQLNVKDTQCPAKVFRGESIRVIQEDLKIADLAFDVNLLYLLKRKGYRILETPTEWTDKLGSKVTQTLFRSSLTMLLSALRLRLLYSPLRGLLPWVRPLEVWLYAHLRAPFIPMTEARKPAGDSTD